MASGFPIVVNGIRILSSEALYQLCRFPEMPELQQKIISQRSPMSAKMVTKPFRDRTRKDWENVKNEIMRWCLRVKLAHNFIKFGLLLESTHDKPIVEDSGKDKYWGAKREGDKFVGVNALGRLLMELRKDYNSEKRYTLLKVPALKIQSFLILDQAIRDVDETENFIQYLRQQTKTTGQEYEYEYDYQDQIAVQEHAQNLLYDKNKKEKTKKKSKARKKNINLTLFE
jgi:ribA/ribD-fused uncharacterized protein